MEENLEKVAESLMGKILFKLNEVHKQDDIDVRDYGGILCFFSRPDGSLKHGCEAFFNHYSRSEHRACAYIGFEDTVYHREIFGEILGRRYYLTEKGTVLGNKSTGERFQGYDFIEVPVSDFIRMAKNMDKNSGIHLPRVVDRLRKTLKYGYGLSR